MPDEKTMQEVRRYAKTDPIDCYVAADLRFIPRGCEVRRFGRLHVGYRRAQWKGGLFG